MIVETEIGKDIEINGIEVGSYGIRSHNNFTWCYGTGCAEPRLSQILEDLNLASIKNVIPKN